MHSPAVLQTQQGRRVRSQEPENESDHKRVTVCKRVLSEALRDSSITVKRHLNFIKIN